MYYKDPQNNLHSIDSSEYEHMLPAGSVPISDTEADAIRLAAIPVPTKSDMWQRIKNERDRRKDGGYKVGAKWYHSDVSSRVQQLGLLMMGANVPAGLQWKTMDGSFVGMTPTLAGQIFGAAAASDIAIFTAAETHNATMQASATPETYDYSTGWPVAYGE